MKRYMKHGPTVGMLFILTISSIVFSQRSGVITTGNSEAYLSTAFNLYTGQPYSNFDQPPLFPYLIATSSYLFGFSVKSAYVIVELFNVLNVVAVFLFGLLLFGKWVGFSAGLVMISSYAINYAASFLHLDNIIIFFIFLYLLLCYLALTSNRRVLFVLSGCSLSLVFYCKPYFVLQLLLIPLIGVSIFKCFRKGPVLANVGLLIVSFVAALSPWIYVGLESGAGTYELLGLNHIVKLFPDVEYNHVSAGDQIRKVVLAAASPFTLTALKKYYLFHMKKYVCLTPFILMCLGTFAVRVARRKEAKYIFVSITGLCFLLVIIPAMYVDTRMGGLVFVLPLLYVILFSETLHYVEYCVGKMGTAGKNCDASSRLTHCVFALLTCFAVGYQWLNDSPVSAKRIMLEGNSYGHKWKKPFGEIGRFEVVGRYNEDVLRACSWLVAHADEKSKVAIGFNKDAIRVYTGERFSLVNLGGIESDRTLIRLTGEDGGSAHKRKVLFVYPYVDFSAAVKWSRYMMFVLEDSLIETLIDAEIDYVFLSGRRLVLFMYFDSVEWAKLVFENDGVRVYEIDSDNVCESRDFEIVVGDWYGRVVRMWQETFSSEYLKYQTVLDYLALDNEELVKHSYTEYQRKWVRENIHWDVRIGFHWHGGEFLIKNDERAEYIGYKDHRLKDLARKYDLLFIHNDQRRYNTFPRLFRQLDALKPLKKFPTMYTMGRDGWEIYDLRDVRDKDEKGNSP
jgi:hypothetical protein